MKRWMYQKTQRMKVQIKAAKDAALNTSHWEVAHIQPSHHDTPELVAAFLANGGKVNRVPCEGKMPRDAMSRRGRRGAVASKACYGNGTRKWVSAVC